MIHFDNQGLNGDYLPARRTPHTHRHHSTTRSQKRDVVPRNQRLSLHCLAHTMTPVGGRNRQRRRLQRCWCAPHPRGPRPRLGTVPLTQSRSRSCVRDCFRDLHECCRALLRLRMNVTVYMLIKLALQIFEGVPACGIQITQ